MSYYSVSETIRRQYLKTHRLFSTAATVTLCVKNQHRGVHASFKIKACMQLWGKCVNSYLLHWLVSFILHVAIAKKNLGHQKISWKHILILSHFGLKTVYYPLNGSWWYFIAVQIVIKLFYKTRWQKLQLYIYKSKTTDVQINSVQIQPYTPYSFFQILNLIMLYEFINLHKEKKVLNNCCCHWINSSPLFSGDLDLFKRHDGTINTLISLDVFYQSTVSFPAAVYGSKPGANQVSYEQVIKVQS